MRFPAQKMLVRGIKKSKGEFEGQKYDSTKFYIETDLDDSKGNAVGMATVEYTFGDSTEFDKYAQSVKFPAEAQIEFEVVTSGKTQKMSVASIKFTKSGPETIRPAAA